MTKLIFAFRNTATAPKRDSCLRDLKFLQRCCNALRTGKQLPTFRISVLPPPYSLSSPAVQPLISKSWRRRQPPPPKRRYLSVCILWRHKTLKSSRFLFLPHQTNWEHERIFYLFLISFSCKQNNLSNGMRIIISCIDIPVSSVMTSFPSRYRIWKQKHYALSLSLS